MTPENAEHKSEDQIPVMSWYSDRKRRGAPVSCTHVGASVKPSDRKPRGLFTLERGGGVTGWLEDPELVFQSGIFSHN